MEHGSQKASWHVSANRVTPPPIVWTLECSFNRKPENRYRKDMDQVLESYRSYFSLVVEPDFHFCFCMPKKKKKKGKILSNMHTYAAELKVFIIPVKVIYNQIQTTHTHTHTHTRTHYSLVRRKCAYYSLTRCFLALET